VGRAPRPGSNSYHPRRTDIRWRYAALAEALEGWDPTAEQEEEVDRVALEADD
jgi:hypothetical protein